jgi:hypothetical protein
VILWRALVEVGPCGVWEIAGAGFLGVMPDGKQRRVSWLGTLDRGDEAGTLRDA